jgi:hypothetical protein
MRHHPIVVQQEAYVGSSGGISPLVWLVVIIGVVTVIYVIYKFKKS